MKKYFLYVMYALFLIIYYWLVTLFTKQLNVFFEHCNIILTILFLFLLYNIDKKNTNDAFLIYILSLVVILYFRKKVDYGSYFSFDFYLFKWLKIIFSNKIVFLNIISNIILFIPLAIFLVNYDNTYLVVLLISLGLIILFEFGQVITKRGIFDIIDILLNFCGVLIGIFICFLHRIFKKIENKK